MDAASGALAAGASGAFSAMKTTVLITKDESMAAMTKAGQVADPAGSGLA